MTPDWTFVRSRAHQLVQLLGRLSYAHLAIAHGLYFFVGGVWPLLSMSSFLAVTGPKADLWLVQTTGLLLAVIGVVLFTAGVRWKVSLEVFILALGSAAALAGIEIYTVSVGRISGIYLLDAVIELVLIALWLSIRIRGGGDIVCGTLYDPSLDPLRRERGERLEAMQSGADPAVERDASM